MNKTVCINGSERIIDNKDKYGMYHVFLDDKDIRWLNSIQFKKYWKEGKGKKRITYVIEEREYPHDENCEGSMCYCLSRRRK